MIIIYMNIDTTDILMCNCVSYMFTAKTYIFEKGQNYDHPGE